MVSSSSTPTPTTTTTTAHNKTITSTTNITTFKRFSSSSSSSSKPAHTKTNSSSTNKTMEEVWKDINLASLNDQSTRPMSTTFGGILFQDFLARPFTINDPQNNTSNSSSYSSASEGGSLYCAAASPTPHPLTALSLGSRPEFHHHHFDHHHHNLSSNGGLHTGGSSNGGCFSAANPSSSSPFDTLPCFGSKRFSEPADAALGGDRKNKRMIKNRESAARSRARKQAYTNELQLKVDHLLEENARLKRQQQQLCEAAASQQKKRSSLYRTSTF